VAPAPTAPAAPAATAVVIDPDVASQLTAGGEDLSAAVDQALRNQLTMQRRAAEAGEDERMPFWLARDTERSGELEDELRDRVIQRHESEDGNRE